MPKRKQNVPGSIYVRKGTKKLTIKYRGRQYPTGINDSVAGRKIAEGMLNEMHFNYIHYNRLPILTKTIKEAFNIFLAEHCKGLGKPTVAMYEFAFKIITSSDYPISDERIDKDITTFATEYTGKVKPITFSNYLRFYGIFINFCLKKKWLFNYPEVLRNERKISRKNQTKRKVIPFEKTEFDMIVSYAMEKDKEFALLLLFLWYTGARLGETIAMRWDQIDMKQRRIRFANKINTEDDDYIPISSAVETIFNELRKIKNGEKVFRWIPSTKPTLNRWLNSAMKKLKIDRQERGFHAIRRTFATNLFESNVSLADVKDLMRHKDIKTTIEHYKAKKGQRLEAIVEQSIVRSETAPKLHL